jgi:hypothetical protein
VKKNVRESGFDLSDTPDEKGRPSPPQIPSKRPAVRQTSPSDPRQPKMNPSSHLPGLPPKKTEAPSVGTRRTRSTSPTSPTPPGGTEVTPQQAAASLQAKSSSPMQAPQKPTSPMNAPPTRAQSPTQQLTAQGNVPGSAEQNYDVNIPGVGVYRTKATDPQRAALAIQAHLQGGNDPDVPSAQARSFDHNQFKVTPTAEATAGGSIGSGPQKPLGEIGLEAFRQLVNSRIQEIVRKKEGGGGYNLYSPNKGKRKTAKPVGEFPTRLAAKRAELARFPPKDPEQLKRARKRLDKLTKDPKKKQDAERKELSAKKPRRSGKAAGERKARKESLIVQMANQIAERLFREDEVPGSPWDERISNLHPDALGTGQEASQVPSGDGEGVHRSPRRRPQGPGEGPPWTREGTTRRDRRSTPAEERCSCRSAWTSTERRSDRSTCTSTAETSASSSPMRPGRRSPDLDPSTSKNLRGGLMSFQEDHLPKLDRAKNAWSERDSYLDKLHQRLEKSVNGMSGVELHLARQLMNKRRR